jgi:peptide/nickel transport system substrate-binding protein
MVKRALLAGISLAMAAVFVISCGPSATSTKPATSTAPATTTATTTAPKPTTATTVPPSGKPQYGGIVTLINPANITIFGAAISNRPGGTPFLWEQITTADRTISLANGGKTDYGDGPTAMKPDVIGNLAAKWSTPDPTTWVLDIRQGVHFAKIPNNVASDLANGREMTADDVIASIEFIRDTPSSWASVAEPVMEKAMTLEKTGPWQVTVRTPKNPGTVYLWVMGGGGSQFVWPKEWLSKYGTNNDWRVQVGTGAFYMTDWVDNSVLTMARNPNYWDKNPIGPGKGDQLPYPDGVKMLIIPDISTQLAAFRTNKADMFYIGSVSREDWNSLHQTNPQIKNYRVLNLPLQIGFRRDKPDLPFKDIRVRQALMMATDMNSIKTGQFGGEAEILDSPARILYPSCYTPMNQLPVDVQALYTYNVDKAKALLKDAGYPNGFKTTLTIDSSGTASDMAQIIKSQWIKAGVDVEIQIKENAVFTGLWSARSYDQMMMTRNAGGNNALFVRTSFGYFRGTNSYNISYVNDPPGSDPVIEKAFEEENKYINLDFAAVDKIHKDANVYILSQAFLVPTPADYVNRVWQPWIKDYFGEGPSKLWIQYLWVDQTLKNQVTGR